MGLPYLVATAALILSSWTGHLLKAYQVPVLHESSAGTIIGLLIGFAGFILFPGHALQTVGSFDNNLFFNAILPPIIFSAAYSLKKKNFFSNFGSIMAFGILATFMSFAIQSVILISASKNEILYRLGEKEEERGIQLSTLECLLLASVMSSTDSVAALSLLDPQVVPSLCGILSGEAIVNDAVSIVLFRSIISLASKRQRTDGLALSFRFHDVLIIILDFIKNIFSSTIIGFLFGIICAVLLRLQPRQSHPYRDIAILFLFAYLSYELAEALELSGIITLFFCGVAMTHYAWYNIPKHTRFASLMGAKSLGFLAESFLFICLGAYVFRHTSKSDWSPMLAVVIFLAVLTSRTVSTIILGFFLNLVRKRKINWRMQAIIWWTGIVRGALSFVLCLQISSPNSTVMVTSSLSVAVFTILVFSSLTKLLVMFLSKSPLEPLVVSSHDKHSVPAIVRIWKYIDNKLIKPWARNDWKIENDQEARKTVVESSIFSKRQATISEDAADPFFSIYYDHIPSRDHTPHRDIRVATDRGTELLLENDEFLIRDEQKNPGASSAEQSDDSEDE